MSFRSIINPFPFRSSLPYFLMLLVLLSNTTGAEDGTKALSITAAEKPVLIGPGVISTKQGEFSATLDVARNELFFMRRTPGLFDYTIYSSVFGASGWSEPVIAPFSGQHRDAAPHLDPTGQTIFFDSRRPAEGLVEGSINLWRAERTDTGWSEATLLRSASANPAQSDRAGDDEFGPAVDGSGAVYFYSFRQPFRAGAFYRAEPDAFDVVELDQTIPDPSAPTFVSYLYLSPDGSTVVMEGLADRRRDSDLFYSCRLPTGEWSAPRSIPNINTSAGEGGPWMTPDGSILMFSSDRPSDYLEAGAANLYMVSTDELPVPCSK